MLYDIIICISPMIILIPTLYILTSIEERTQKRLALQCVKCKN